MPETITARVRCCGQMHRIAYRPYGPLALLDHTSVTEALAVDALTDCRCGEVIRAWRDKDVYRLPKDLAPKASRAQWFASARQKYRAPGADPLATPLRDRMAARVKAIATAQLDRCTYRRCRSQWAGGIDNWIVTIAPQPSLSRTTWKEWSSNGKWSGTSGRLDVALRLDWFARVYKRGLAIVDGCFILDYDPETGIFLAAKQCAGLAIEARSARLSKRGKLQWL